MKPDITRKRIVHPIPHCRSSCNKQWQKYYYIQISFVLCAEKVAEWWPYVCKWIRTHLYFSLFTSWLAESNHELATRVTLNPDKNKDWKQQCVQRVSHISLDTFVQNPSSSLRAWWRHQMETFPALLVLQRPLNRCFDVFFDLRLNKRLSKQSCSWWFEMLPCSLRRHCNGFYRLIRFDLPNYCRDMVR